jgi:gamma-glutamyl-gamma-aminobutyrate hydrolase PuuD
MQPIIGITTAIDPTGEMYHGFEISYITRQYARTVRRLGGQPVLLDSNIDPMVAAKLCDGIVISGGHDIDSRLYGQEPRNEAKKAARERTDWERLLIDACDACEKPILGICYGMQLLNVHYGGSLFQDIKDDYHSNLFHGSIKQPVVHPVTFDADFMGYRVGDLAKGTHIHHQAVDRLAEGFTVVAHAEDGIAEAMVGRGHYAIQWHAELDGTAPQIYGEFIKKCQAHPSRAIKILPKVGKLPRFLPRFTK